MRVSVFGATGSIGESTFDLLRARPDLQTVALTGGRNVARLAAQARALRAELAVTAYDDCLEDLRAALKGSGTEVAAGTQALIDAASRPAELGYVPPSWARQVGTGLSCAGPRVHAGLGQQGNRLSPQARLY